MAINTIPTPPRRTDFRLSMLATRFRGVQAEVDRPLPQTATPPAGVCPGPRRKQMPSSLCGETRG